MIKYALPERILTKENNGPGEDSVKLPSLQPALTNKSKSNKSHSSAENLYYAGRVKEEEDAAAGSSNCGSFARRHSSTSRAFRIKNLSINSGSQMPMPNAGNSLDCRPADNQDHYTK